MHNFRKTLLATAVCALAPAMTAPLALAQKSPMMLEEVVVTGTRKEGQLPTETLAPIDVISSESLTRQAGFSLTDSLTAIAPSLNTQRFPIADGTAFIRPVTLRNLSPDHTLVLVDGTRRHRSALVNLQASPFGTNNLGSQAVDFGTIPSAAVKRVEVLRDGASAQYGSDAIAGVVNVILKDADEGFSISGQYGEYDESDGERSVVSANAGFSLGGDGFLNLTGEYANTDTTSRGVARPDAAGPAAIVGKDLVPYNGLGQRWGDPDLESYTGVFNTAYNITENVELYGNGSYYYNEVEGGFFYRGPVLPTAEDNIAFPPRSTLMTDSDGDGLPDNASQSLVDSIIGDGLNPSDYLTADASSPSGFVALNPIHTEFPGGYGPIFGADITDVALVLGTRGETDNNLSWDLTGRYGQNEVEYNLSESINPSLGGLSPTSFKPGTLTQEEFGFNLDFVKTFDDNPASLGYGVEWRRETYEIEKGNAASIAVGPTAAQFGTGSDGFQGFFDDTEGTWDSDSYAAYFDLETDITEKLTGAFAMRYENFDEVNDSTLNYKISARYDFTDNFALRGTTSTGFRAPTPGQTNTLNVSTSADSSGNLVPTGTYPVENPVAQVLGATPLENEESTSYTAGLVWTPLDNVSFTMDYYNIKIEDRLGQSINTISQQNVDDLNAQGFPNADLLLGTEAKYFTSGSDTQVTGIDLSLTTWHDIGNGTLTTDMRHNHNEQDVNRVNSNISRGQVFDMENQVPEDSSVLSLTYDLDAFSGLVRANYYGDWETTPGQVGDQTASKSNTYNYGSAVLVDLEASYTIAEHYTFTVGGQNIFDEYPDKEGDPTLQFLGVKYAVTSPFGFNGAFWYARVSAAF
jgi:iron complex outermembrane receptor protein